MKHIVKYIKQTQMCIKRGKVNGKILKMMNNSDAYVFFNFSLTEIFQSKLRKKYGL